MFKANEEVPEAVITALMLMLRAAVSVSRLALQLTAALTLMSPLPPALPLLLRMVMGPPARLPLSVLPEILPPLAAMVKSAGSISQ